jgi:serine/threonine protein kinase
MNTIHPINPLFPDHQKIEDEKQINERKESFPIDALKKAFYEKSRLNENQVNLIANYIEKNLDNLIEQTYQKQTDIHLRPRETGLPIPLEISKAKEVIFPLKKWGALLGQGSQKVVKQAIFLLQRDFILVAHSTETGFAKNAPLSELKIFLKIAEFLKKQPEAKGLLKFYTLVVYTSEINKEKIEYYQQMGYELNLYMTPSDNDEKRGIITKFYNGGTLYHLLETSLDEKLNLEDKFKIADCILQGLSHLHSLGIFHSDLKLNNIFIEMDLSTNRVKEAVIGDYGLSSDLTVQSDRFYKGGADIFQAPELSASFIGKSIDENIFSADVYSMGLVIKKLFRDVKHPALTNLIQEMLEEDPKKRPSAQLAQEKLESLRKDFLSYDRSKING